MAGFGLIEVLITLVVLSLGLLGLAGLQATSMRFNHDSQLRSMAVLQAYAMADRMRANPVALAAGQYNSVSGVPTDPNCTTCTPAQMATRDAFEWNTSNAALLPAGQGTVTVNGNLHAVTVHWDNNRSGVTGLGCSGNPTVDLTCFRLSVQL